MGQSHRESSGSEQSDFQQAMQPTQLPEFGSNQENQGAMSAAEKANVPTTPEAVEAYFRGKFPDLIKKYEEKEKTADLDYLPFIAEFEALGASSEDEAKADDIWKRFIALSKQKIQESGENEVAEIRGKLYDDESVAKMLEWDKALEVAGASNEERARLASMYRNAVRELVRKLMSDTNAVAVLRARDTVKYGQGDGITFDQAVRKEYTKGATTLEEAYRNMVVRARKHDKSASSLANNNNNGGSGGGGSGGGSSGGG